jgi:hypothetical protein
MTRVTSLALLIFFFIILKLFGLRIVKIDIWILWFIILKCFQQFYVRMVFFIVIMNDIILFIKLPDCMWLHHDQLSMISYLKVMIISQWGVHFVHNRTINLTLKTLIYHFSNTSRINYRNWLHTCVRYEFSSASSKYGSTFICWRHKWRNLVYVYSWAKSPMISGYALMCSWFWCVQGINVFMV